MLAKEFNKTLYLLGMLSLLVIKLVVLKKNVPPITPATNSILILINNVKYFYF